MSPALAISGRGSRERLARSCGLASTTCLFALAPVMVVAHRSSVLLLSLTALLAVAGDILAGRGPALREAALRQLASSLGLSTLAFLVWALASAFWSASSSASLGAWGEFVLPLGAGLLIAVVTPTLDRRSAAILLGASLTLASAMILADLATGLGLRRAAGLRPDSFVLNRPTLVLAALLPAALLLLWLERWRWAAVLVASTVVLAVLRSDSGAARLGLLAMVSALAVVVVSGRVARILATGGLLAALALAPVAGEIADRLLPDRAHQALAGSHARDRVDIWLSFGAALREAPLIGQGFGASARLGSAPVAARVAPDHAAYLAVGHPHSAPLQIWVELGAVGAALAGAACWLLVRSLAGLSRVQNLAAIPLLAAVAAVGLVGHGAWQGWWPAAIGAAVSWLRLGRAGGPA